MAHQFCGCQIMPASMLASCSQAAPPKAVISCANPTGHVMCYGQQESVECISQLKRRSDTSRPGMITMLQINMYYLLNAYEVHKSLTPRRSLPEAAGWRKPEQKSRQPLQRRTS